MPLKYFARATTSRSPKVTDQVEYDLDNGLALSQAISAFPDSFDPLYWRLISAGESSGTLEQTLVNRLSALLQR